MSSNPHPRAPTTRSDEPIPFASYAQVVRMLLPLTGKVSFYDDRGEALWISDGLEEPELRLHVEVLLSRFASDAAAEAAMDCSADDQGQPIYVFPIRNQNERLVGAMAIVFRDLPARTTYRRAETVERLISPLLQMLSHAWGRVPEVLVPVLEPHADRPQPPALGDSIDGPTPLPALLRRTLAVATHRLQCSFGAIIVTTRPFTLTHRASPDESDLTMNAAIESVRAPMLKLMQVRNEPLLVNSGAGRDQPAPYKFLVLPLRPNSNQLGALLMLFRKKQQRDFTSADLEELMQILARLSPSALADLAPERVTVSAPRAAAPAPATVAPPQPLKSDALQRTQPPALRPPVQSEPLQDARTSAHAAAVTPSRSTLSLVITPDAAPTMESRIRTALDEGRFDLFAQPITSLRSTERASRYEVLVRMHDADRLRTPATFFEAAEAGTLLPDLDRWVIRRLLTTLRSHANTVRSGRWEFCINIAAQSLITDRFSEFIVAEVCKSSIPPGLLVFEISECDALEHQSALELMGARLRDVGCRIALDNCRAGLTTFGPLRKWPISCVKIDGSLIAKIANHSRSESIVRAVSQLASSMGIETVAERVESGDLCDMLRDIGIDYAQGFHFGSPQPLGSVFV